MYYRVDERYAQFYRRWLKMPADARLPLPEGLIEAHGKLEEAMRMYRRPISLDTLYFNLMLWQRLDEIERAMTPCDPCEASDPEQDEAQAEIDWSSVESGVEVIVHPPGEAAQRGSYVGPGTSNLPKLKGYVRVQINGAQKPVHIDPAHCRVLELEPVGEPGA